MTIANDRNRTVESEIGRIRMPSFTNVVSTLKPKERVWAFSFSRLCIEFCKDLSYRRAADLINTGLHRSEEDSIKVSTLVEFIERIGGEIQDYLTDASETILKDHPLDLKTIRTEGEPSINADVAEPEPTAEQKLWENEVAKKAEEINAHREGEEQEQIKDLENLPHMESPQEKCCYISIDDIGVKHQKETRKNGGSKSVKNVENTVIHIQNGDESYYLTAFGMDKAFRMLVAFLVANKLIIDYSLVFFADGARNIKNNIEKYFSSRQYTLILDWYHLKKKCKELISSALSGSKEQKKDYTQCLLRMLWVDNVKEAINYLNGLDKSKVKSSHWLEELTGYLERKETQIVCYALRHELGLRISSNRVEKANDRLVAQRQKHSGMSWSFKGSSSLASISMIMLNNETDR